MSARGFLYFAPGASTLSRKDVEALGLGYLFDGRAGGITAAATSAGPGGQSGCFFGVPGRRDQGALEPADAGRRDPSDPKGEKLLMRWSPLAGTSAWIGVLDDALPGPTDLARTERIDGHEVELGDGKAWLVPVVRALDGGTRLPRALTWDGSRWENGDVRPVYRDLWRAGLRLWDAIVGAPDGEAVLLSSDASTAVAALSVNYRIGPAEASALGLLDTRSAGRILEALIDVPSLEAIRGKAEAAPPS